jgi:hypothetical protein
MNNEVSPPLKLCSILARLPKVCCCDGHSASGNLRMICHQHGYMIGWTLAAMDTRSFGATIYYLD